MVRIHHLPPLLFSQGELEAERKLVEANRELAARFDQKLQSKLAEIWGNKHGYGLIFRQRI
jgi:hypothetical protein